MITRTVLTKMAVIVAAGAVVLVGGCQNDAMTGSAIGALAGAGIGQLAGGHTESTLIGAAVGAGAGYIFGNESERKKQQAEMKEPKA